MWETLDVFKTKITESISNLSLGKWAYSERYFWQVKIVIKIIFVNVHCFRKEHRWQILLLHYTELDMYT